MIALSIVMILLWMALVFIPAYRLSKTGGDFVTAIDHMQSIDRDNDYHTGSCRVLISVILVRLICFCFSETTRVLLNQTDSRAHGNPNQDNPGLYIEYVNAYQWDFESYPADMLTVAERIDPGNALFLNIATG